MEAESFGGSRIFCFFLLRSSSSIKFYSVVTYYAECIQPIELFYCTTTAEYSTLPTYADDFYPRGRPTVSYTVTRTTRNNQLPPALQANMTNTEQSNKVTSGDDNNINDDEPDDW